MAKCKKDYMIDELKFIGMLFDRIEEDLGQYSEEECLNYVALIRANADQMIHELYKLKTMFNEDWSDRLDVQ